MDANWWNNALQSYDVGRSHRADRENARAFQDGGLDAVADTAGRRGDLQGMETARMMTRRQRQFEDDEHENAFNWFEKNAPYARNVLRRARAIQDPQQRGAWLQSQRQRFEGMGFQPEQIDGAIAALTNPETADEAFASYDAAFSQYEAPDWRPMTDAEQGAYGLPDNVSGAVGPDGQPRVIYRPPAGRASQGPGSYEDDGYDYEGG